MELASRKQDRAPRKLSPTTTMSLVASRPRYWMSEKDAKEKLGLLQHPPTGVVEFSVDQA